ncbi:MAG: Cache 3/Cache 2 fusion domain-containing protein, partial [Gammaproteobacteria bacterium]|nr:Cache 3/Cache 2 fusion domain-containing protein [Gammaproteobacteria bacterium]
MSPLKITQIGRMSISHQLSILVILAVVVVFSIFTSYVTVRTANDFEESVEHQLKEQVKMVSSTLEFFYDSLVNNTDKLSSIFFGMFDDDIVLDEAIKVDVNGEEVPVLTYRGRVLNQNFAFPDRFTKMTGGTATIFMRNRDDFLRISTSLRKTDGSRAFGTYLGKTHPGYETLMSGKSYIGPAHLFGKHYMTKYTPFKDDSGKVIGILYVGFDYSAQLALLKQKLSSMVFGDTGYVYAISAKPGKNQGVLTLHPSLEGKNLLEIPDAAGN